MRGKVIRPREIILPVAAVVSAVSTLACCLPLAIAGGVGAAGVAVILEPLRPWLLGFAAVLLGIGGLQLCFSRRACRRSSRMSLVIFCTAAAAVLAMVLFPQTVASFSPTVSRDRVSNEPPIVYSLHGTLTFAGLLLLQPRECSGKSGAAYQYYGTFGRRS